MLSTNPEWFGHNPHNQSVFEIHISLPLVCCCHCWWMKYSADNVRIQLHLHQQQTTSPLTVVTENWTQPILFNSIANAFQMNKAKRLIVHFRSIDRYCKSDSHLFPLPRIAHVKRTEFNAFAHFICMLMAGVQLEWAILAQNKLFLGCFFFRLEQPEYIRVCLLCKHDSFGYAPRVHAFNKRFEIDLQLSFSSAFIAFIASSIHWKSCIVVAYAWTNTENCSLELINNIDRFHGGSKLCSMYM